MHGTCSNSLWMDLRICTRKVSHIAISSLRICSSIAITFSKLQTLASQHLWVEMAPECSKLCWVHLLIWRLRSILENRIREPQLISLLLQSHSSLFLLIDHHLKQQLRKTSSTDLLLQANQNHSGRHIMKLRKGMISFQMSSRTYLRKWWLLTQRKGLKWRKYKATHGFKEKLHRNKKSLLSSRNEKHSLILSLIKIDNSRTNREKMMFQEQDAAVK